jgi:hypothetical protein
MSEELRCLVAELETAAALASGQALTCRSGGQATMAFVREGEALGLRRAARVARETLAALESTR